MSVLSLQKSMRDMKDHADALLDNILNHPNLTEPQINQMPADQKKDLRRRVKIADDVSYAPGISKLLVHTCFLIILFVCSLEVCRCYSSLHLCLCQYVSLSTSVAASMGFVLCACDHLYLQCCICLHAFPFLAPICSMSMSVRVLASVYLSLASALLPVPSRCEA